MKFLVTVVCLFAFVGCKEETSPSRQTVFTMTGIYRSVSDNWQVTLSKDEPFLAVQRNVRDANLSGEFEGTSAVSPSDWNPTGDAFVLADASDKIWAFNGVDRVWILERHGNGSRSWGLNCPYDFPVEFSKRLPQSILKRRAEQVSAGNPLDAL